MSFRAGGSNPSKTSESDNSAIYQDTILKFDIHPLLFLIYFFLLRPKEKKMTFEKSTVFYG